MKTIPHLTLLMLVLPAITLSFPRAAGSFSQPPAPVTPEAALSLTWLEASQNVTGSWGNAAPIRDTLVSTLAIRQLDPTSARLAPAYAWLLNAQPLNHADLSRQVFIQAKAGKNVTSLTAKLLAGQIPATTNTVLPNYPEGGWGAAPGYRTDCLNTALALQALAAAGQGGAARKAAVDYLLAARNSDGGWGILKGASSQVYITAQVLLALKEYTAVVSNPQAILDAGATYLGGQQNPDGGWGAEVSTTHESGWAVYALRALGKQPADLRLTENYFFRYNRWEDGSWNGQPYDTALALLALNLAEPPVYRFLYLPAVRGSQ